MSAYRVCPDCGHETLHDPLCGWCFPKFDAEKDDIIDCAVCGEPFRFLPQYANKKYCSRRCQSKAYYRTEKGQAAAQRKKERAKMARLEYLGSLSSLERSA